MNFPNPLELTDHGAICAPSANGSTMYGRAPLSGFPDFDKGYLICSTTGMNCMKRVPSCFRN